MSVKKIVLECPQCHKSKLQKIPESLMEQRNQIEKGIVAVLIPEATLCAHGFIVYIDMNFSCELYSQLF